MNEVKLYRVKIVLRSGLVYTTPEHSDEGSHNLVYGMDMCVNHPTNSVFNVEVIDSQTGKIIKAHFHTDALAVWWREEV